MGANAEWLHEMDSPWPPFLDLLDSDPRRALEGLYSFAWKLCEARPPAILRKLDRQDREDRVADLVISCHRDGFSKLRKYQNQGKPFAAWLTTVLDRQVRSWLRGRRPLDELSDDIGTNDPDPPGNLSAHVIECVKRCLGRLSEKCRLYLACVADGMKPREIAQLLMLPEGGNKQVSDDLRHCMGRLRELLLAEGVRPEEVTL